VRARTFHIANFGCRAAQSEGASIHQELASANAEETASAFGANVVIVNSCTVTEEADREVRQLIRRVASRNPKAQIIVTGCYAQRAPEEVADLPGVRFVVGNSHKPLVGQIALTLFDEFPTHGRAETLCSSIFLDKNLNPPLHQGSAGRTRAVVKIQDGCNANCSFCIIPSVRGRSRSMNGDTVVAEVRELVSRGYKEVVFSGIHLGSYGRDLPTKTSLYELLCRVLELPGLSRLRLSSIEPLEVTSEIIGLVATHPRMAHHLHVPLQSGSNRVLRAMYRPYSRDYYSELVGRIRTNVPDAAIGADVMVGFPGETDEDFRETYRLIQESPLTYLHVFPFSSRPGTVAAGLAYPVPAHVSRFRAKTLRVLIAEKNEAFRRTLVGQEIEVLTLEDSSAISSNFVRISVPSSLPVNQWTRVVVSGLDEDGVRADFVPAAV
jgi:threonylcarbamoyladenosine tRNA methylthiotransferase MtaB